MSNLVQSTVMRTHLSGGLSSHWVIALLNKTNLLWLAIALKRDIIDHIDSAINELFFWEQSLENKLSVSHIETMKVLSLDFFLCSNCDSIKQPQLRDMEQDLETVEFAILNRVTAHVKFSYEWQVLDISKLTCLPNIVQLNSKESKTLGILKSL